MSEGLKQRLVFVVAAAMMLAALAVLNLGSTAIGNTECEPHGDPGPSPSESSPSPSPSESEDPFPPSLPPILPTESDSPSPSPSDTEGQARDCGSEITINHRDPDIERPGRDKFYGKVRSDEDACESGRRVTVRKVRRGPDRRFDTTVTDQRGRWTVPGKGARGRFYAETPQEKVSSEQGPVTCSADKSKTIRV